MDSYKGVPLGVEGAWPALTIAAFSLLSGCSEPQAQSVTPLPEAASGWDSQFDPLASRIYVDTN